MWKIRVNMRFSPINSGIYHISTFSLVFLPFQNSGDEMCNTCSFAFATSELHTSTHLPTNIIPRFMSNQLPLSTTLWRPIQSPSPHLSRTTPSQSNTAIYYICDESPIIYNYNPTPPYNIIYTILYSII